MARPVDHEHRGRLLQLVADDLLEQGLTGATLGRLAGAAGTSSRMLVHHFGSRDALVGLALARARQDELALMRAELPTDAEFVARLPNAWRWFSGRRARQYFRLFGEVAAQARLRDPGDATGARLDLTQDWLNTFTAGFEACDLEPREARLAATELVALVRGLVLDLEATGDVARVTEAYRRRVIR